MASPKKIPCDAVERGAAEGRSGNGHQEHQDRARAAGMPPKNGEQEQSVEHKSREEMKPDDTDHEEIARRFDGLTIAEAGSPRGIRHSYSGEWTKGSAAPLTPP